MKKYLFLIALAATAFAGADDDYVRDVKKFEALIRGCDKLIISPNPFVPDTVQSGITIDGISAVKKVADGIYVSDKLLCREFVIENGREVPMRFTCQCYGEGDLLFFRNGRLRLKARIFHWKTLDVEPAEGPGFVLDLVGRSKDLEWIWDFFFPEPRAQKG